MTFQGFSMSKFMDSSLIVANSFLNFLRRAILQGWLFLGFVVSCEFIPVLKRIRHIRDDRLSKGTKSFTLHYDV